MKEFFITLLLGIVAGAVDVLPMMKMKLDRHSIASAFVFYLILPFVILNIDLYGLVWWLKGGVTGLALALPVIIIVSGEDKKSVPPMIVMSAVLGTAISAAGHFIL